MASVKYERVVEGVLVSRLVVEKCLLGAVPNKQQKIRRAHMTVKRAWRTHFEHSSERYDSP